ncbi:hypothetical protein B481_0877 [Planococcus halocryophilus Or1]|nr:hypothetical protein B481_0877 [Planococcus halocryophilus Or1]
MREVSSFWLLFEVIYDFIPLIGLTVEMERNTVQITKILSKS